MPPEHANSSEDAISGDGSAASTHELIEEAYTALHRVASGKLANERSGHTLQPTALVNEAYLRIAGPDGNAMWANKKQFFAAAAEAMRRILIEQARRKRAQKRGGDLKRTAFSDTRFSCATPDDELLAVNEALERLGESDPSSANLVKMRFFAGFGMDEIAEALGVSRSTATRQWAYARAWLYKEIEGA